MFFKKKQKEVVSSEVVPVENKEELMNQAEMMIKELEGKSGDARISILDQIGIHYCDAQEYDLAIQYLEMSLNEKKAVGKGYTTLLKVYNVKRKIAAQDKDDEKLQYYLVKIDEMMAISKEVIRSNL